MSSSPPPAVAGKRPIKTYETRYLYTGFSRYNVETKIISTITIKNNKLFYKEAKFEGTTFSRVYSTEQVQINIYSENPRIWSETLNPHETQFFQQVLVT